MKKYLAVFLVLSLVLILVLVGCSSTTTTSKPATSLPTTTTTSTAPPTSTTPVFTKPIKIGAIVSLTGESSITGPPQQQALEYRLKLMNNQFNGRPIELVVADDGSSPTTVIDAVKKLIMFDKVDVILGPTMGAAAVAAGNFMKTADPATPIMIIMAKSGKLLENAPNKNIFLPMGTDLSTGHYTGLYAYDKLGYRTATTLLEDMISGWDKVGGAVAAFEKQGGKSIQQQTVKSGTVDFSAFLAAMKPADCLMVWVTPGLMARFIAQYYDAGKTMPVVIPDASVLFSRTMTQIGDKTIGIVAEVNYTTLIDTAMNKAYVADYTKVVGAVPTIQAAAIDQSLLAFLEALKITGGDTTPAKINAALRQVKIETPAGPIGFNADGLGIGDLYIAQSARVDDRIDWKVLYDYKNIVLDAPK